ncbi:MAG: outer membrane beta-barrel protein [Gammaproteobacteria bacterium]|nr:outer membrane beta-barrel protein [Gammaproteobacteria bacterium]
MRALVLLVLLPVAVLAAEPPRYDFELAALAGQTVGGDVDPLTDSVSTSVSDDGAYAVILNMREGLKKAALLQYELFVGQLENQVQLTGDVDEEYNLRARYLHFGGTYEFSDADFRPYIAASIGMTNLKAEGNSDHNDWSLSFGAGLKWYPTRWLGLRLDARGFGTLYDANTAIICGEGCVAGIHGDLWWQSMVSGGLSIRF